MANAIDIMNMYKQNKSDQAGYLKKGAKLDDAVTNVIKKQREVASFAPSATLAVGEYADEGTEGYTRITPSVDDLRAEDNRVEQLAQMPQYESPVDTSSLFGNDPFRNTSDFIRNAFKVVSPEDGGKLFDMLPSVNTGSGVDVLLNRYFNEAEGVPEDVGNYEAPYTVEGGTEGLNISPFEIEFQRKLAPIFGGIVQAGTELQNDPDKLTEITKGGVGSFLASVSSAATNFGLPALMSANITNMGLRPDTKKYIEDNIFKYAKEANDVVQSMNREYQSGMKEISSPYLQTFKDSYYSLVSNLVGLGLSFATGGSAIPMLALLGASSAGQQFEEYKQKGFSDTVARWGAAFGGIFEIGTEFLPATSAARVMFGKQVAKNIGIGILAEVPGEEVNTLLGEMQTVMMEGVNDDTGDTKVYWDVLKSTIISSTGLMGAAATLGKTRTYSPVAKEAAKVLYNGLTNKIKEGDLDNRGFRERVVRSSKDSWNFFKSGVRLMNDVIKIEKDEVDASYLFEKYGVKLIPQEMDNNLKVRFNQETGAQLPLDAPLEDYYEFLFGKAPKTSHDKVRNNLFRHFYQEDLGGILQEFNKFANRYNVTWNREREEENINNLVSDKTFYTAEPLGKILSDLPGIKGSWMVQHRTTDNQWSKQKEVEIVGNYGSRTLIKIDNTFQFVNNEDISVVKQINENPTVSMFDDSTLSLKRIEREKNNLFVVANKATIIGHNNVISFDENMTDDNFPQNQLEIQRIINHAQRMYAKRVQQPSITVEITDKFNGSIQGSMKSPSGIAHIFSNGLEVGEIIEVVPESSDPYYVKVVDTNDDRYIYDNGWKKTPRTIGTKKRYAVEPVVLDTNKGFENIIIPSKIGVSLKQNAPRTYEELIKRLAEFKEFHDNRANAEKEQANFIWKKLPPEKEKADVVIINSLGEYSSSTYHEVNVDVQAAILEKVFTLKNGKDVYLTTHGYLDGEGNEYRVMTKTIEDASLEYIATDKSWQGLYANGNSVQQITDKMNKLGIENYQILSRGVVISALKKGGIEGIKEIKPSDVIPFVNKHFPEIVGMFNHKETLDNLRFYSYTKDEPGRTRSAFAISPHGMVFLNKEKVENAKGAAISYTHEMIHTFTKLGIVKDSTLSDDIMGFAAKVINSAAYHGIEAMLEDPEELRNKINVSTETLSYALTLPSLRFVLDNTLDDGHTLHDTAMGLLERAIKANTGIRNEASKYTISEVLQKVHEPINAYGSAGLSASLYEFGTKKFYNAIKEGKKTSMIVDSIKYKDVKIGDIIDVLGGGNSAMSVEVVGVDRGLKTLLGLKKSKSGSGAQFWSATNKALAEDISRTEGFNDIVKAKNGKEYKILGSGAISLFNPDSDKAFWKNKKATRIVFKVISKPEVLNKTTKRTKQKDVDLRKPDTFEYKHEPTQADKQFEAVYKKINEAISEGDINEAIRIVNYAVSNNLISEMEVEKLMVRWEAMKSIPAFVSLFDFAVDLHGIDYNITMEQGVTSTSLPTEVATGMGTASSRAKFAPKRKPVKSFTNTEFLGDDTLTTTLPIGSGYYELMIAGEGFDSVFQIHHDSVAEQLQLYLDSDGKAGLNPKSSLAQHHFLVYHDLGSQFGKDSKLYEGVREINEKIMTKTANKFVPFSMVTFSEDKKTDEGVSQVSREIEKNAQSKKLREQEREETDEQITRNKDLIDKIIDAEEKVASSKVTFKDLAKFHQILTKKVANNKNGSSNILSVIPRAIANFVRRVSKRTGANPEVISQHLKDLDNIASKIMLDIPKLFKEAELFNQTPEDYITGIFINNGLPETTTDGSLSARSYARFIINDIMNNHIHGMIARDVEDFALAEAQKRTQEYTVSQRALDTFDRIKEKYNVKLEKNTENMIEFIKSLRFFPDTPEKFRISIESLFGAIKDLQVRSGKVQNGLWLKIDNAAHRKLITDLIALEDDLKRARHDFMSFPGSLNREWSPNLEGDMSIINAEQYFGTPKVPVDKFMADINAGNVTYSKARRKMARAELVRMSAEAGLTEKQTDLMLKDEDRTPQIANQILMLTWKDDVPNAKNLIVRVKPNGSKYLEHIKHHPLVNPIQITDYVTVEQATRVIKNSIEAQLRNIRKYNKKYFEPMFARIFKYKDIGAIGRNYDKILDEYNEKLLEFNELSPEIQANLNSVRNVWRMWTSHLLSHLKELGWLDEKAGWEEYAPYFIDESWQLKRWMGLPNKLKEPPAHYADKAYGTTRERFLKPEYLTDHILNVQYDIIVSQHINQIAVDFDMSTFLTEEEDEKLYHYDKEGNLHEYAKASVEFNLSEDRTNPDGTVVMKAGKYVFWTPEYFKYNLGYNENGESIILDNVRSYLLEENVAKALNALALPYNAIMEKMNKAVSVWKKTIIYTIFPAFNYNNMLGDMQMFFILHPDYTRAIRFLPQAVKFLIKYSYSLKGSQENVGTTRKALNKIIPPSFDPFEMKVKQFIDTYNVIEAGEMRADLGQKDVTNIFKYISSKLANSAMWREAILRTTNAFYLVDQEEKGNTELTRKRFNFLGIDNTLNNLDFLGRVGKSLMIDYFRRSPAYQRWITGFLFPWGHFYLQGSMNVTKRMYAGDTLAQKLKSFLKASTLMSIPPIMFNMFNYGLASMLMGDRDKAEELYGIEMGLPPEMRNRLHLNLGVIGGKTVIWTPQYIPDILIGTKFITVTNNQLFRLVAGEIGPKQFVQQVIKDWGKAELKSGLYLLNPLVRFVQGAISGTDPLDGSPVYSRYNRSTLSAVEQAAWLGVYFNKVCNPLLSTYLTEYNKQHMTHQDAMVKSLERFGYFKTILGWKESGRKLIYSMPTGRENVILKKEGERNITRELAEETRMLMGKEQGLINDIKTDWIRSGLDPLDYAKSKDLESNLKKLYDKVYKNTMSPKQWKSFSKRINNIFKDPDNNIDWAENHLRHMDPESKQYKDLENWKLSLQDYAKKKKKGIPVTIRGEENELIKEIID